jgi:hypothetical protein
MGKQEERVCSGWVLVRFLRVWRGGSGSLNVLCTDDYDDASRG